MTDMGNRSSRDAPRLALTLRLALLTLGRALACLGGRGLLGGLSLFAGCATVVHAGCIGACCVTDCCAGTVVFAGCLGACCVAVSGCCAVKPSPRSIAATAQPSDDTPGRATTALGGGIP